MRISDVTVQRFRYPLQDRARRATATGTLATEHDAVQSLLTITHRRGRERLLLRRRQRRRHRRRSSRRCCVGEDPLYRERIWQRLKERQRLQPGTLCPTAS